jgi:microsomal dipeptidase-like Zn-dependent dipeptidase
MTARPFVLLVLFVASAAGAFLGLAPARIELQANVVHPPTHTRTASAEANGILENGFIADLHADTLLWNRDVNVRSQRGHVDVPRLIEGHVALQAFTVVTRFPRHYDPAGTAGDSDIIGLLAATQLWPPATWTSPMERALYQAQRLCDAAAESRGRLTVIRSARELRSYIEHRNENPDITAGLLGLEGAHALESDVDNLDRLYDAGFRMLGITHVFDNEIGGSGTGLERGGLTDLGFRVLDRAGELGMIIDLAHASGRVIEDVVADATIPILVSHTGVRGTCDGDRNLSDAQVRAIASRGGLIGIGFFEVAVCGLGADHVAAAMAHVARTVGVEHVALGSDFDGGVATPFDATGLAEVAQALLDLGFSRDETGDMMGGNVRRFMLAALP